MPRVAEAGGPVLPQHPARQEQGGAAERGSRLTAIAKEAGFSYHATIVWNEGNISRRTAWGSWLSASAPFVIAPVELIVVLYKDSWKKTGGTRESDITREEFMAWTNGLWTFNGESKNKSAHPAPFPVDLPLRCIKLFTFLGDTVLDPFMGSGSTLVAARQCRRTGIGIDIDPRYRRSHRGGLKIARGRRVTGTNNGNHKGFHRSCRDRSYWI